MTKLVLYIEIPDKDLNVYKCFINYFINESL